MLPPISMSCHDGIIRQQSETDKVAWTSARAIWFYGTTKPRRYQRSIRIRKILRSQSV